MRDVLVNIRSQDAANVTSDHRYEYRFLYPLITQPDEALHVSVHAAQIPNSFYSVPSGGNSFTLTETIGSASAVSRTITLTPGNYNTNNLATNLQTLMTNSSITYSVSFSTITGKLTFSSSTANIVSIQINMVGNTPATVMGFDRSTYSFTNSSGTFSLESAQVCDVTAGIHGIYVHSNLISTSIVAADMRVDNSCIAVIPIDADSGNIISFDNTHRFKIELLQQYISAFHLQLCDSKGSPLDLNGASFEMQLHFSFEKKQKQNELRQLLAVNKEMLDLRMRQFLEHQEERRQKIKAEIEEYNKSIA